MIEDKRSGSSRCCQGHLFSRMRSEGFSFNSGGLGVEPCSRPVVSMFATVRNRPQPFATVRNRSQVFAVER